MQYWTTKEGKRLKIIDMETSHIENCIRMLKKKLAEKPDSETYMGESEYAEDAVEQENRVNDEIAEAIREQISSFRFELKYREAGKPIGEDFPLPVIQNWEVEGYGDSE